MTTGFLFCCRLLIFPPALQATEPPLMLTLEQALELARKNSVDLTLARINLHQFQSLYRQALGNALPDINLQGAYTRNVRRPFAFFPDGKIEVGRDNGFDAALTAEQPLYSGGKVMTGIRAARHGLNAAEKEVVGTDDDVILAVKSLFYGILLSSATATIEQDNLASAQDHLDTIRARYRQGLDSDLTLRRQEVEVANAKATLIRAKNVHEMALISLQELLMLDVDRAIQAIGVLDPPREPGPSYESVSKLAMERHPGLKAARERTQFYQHLIDISIADMKPQLSLFGRLQWSAEADNFSPKESQRGTAAAGGIRLNYPIFTGGDRLERIRRARVEYDRTHEIEKRLERAVKVNVRRQWLDIAAALERARSQEAAIDQARRALEATEIRYRSGQSNQLELNDSTFALNRVRTLYIQAAHDYWSSLAALERAIGGPLSEVKL